MDDIEMLYANESFFDKDKIILSLRSFLLSLRRLLERFIYTLRKIGVYYLPKKVNDTINNLHSKCMGIIVKSYSDQWYDKNRLSDIVLSQEYMNLFHKWSNEDFDKNDYIKVDKNKVISIMKSVNYSLEQEEKMLLKCQYEKGFDDDHYIKNMTEFYRSVYSTDLSILNKYFTFGKQKAGIEIIPVEIDIQATPDLII